MPTESRSTPRIRYADVDSLCIYGVTESELAELEHGSPQSTYFTIAVALISICLSFLANILITKIEDIRIYILYIVIIVATGLVGLILLILWLVLNKKSTPVINTIKDRLKDEKLPAETNADPTTTVPPPENLTS